MVHPDVKEDQGRRVEKAGKENSRDGKAS